MDGKIVFGIERANINVEIEIRNGKIESHEVEQVDSEQVENKVLFYHLDLYEMTYEEYEKFYDENTELIDLVADIQSSIKYLDSIKKVVKACANSGRIYLPVGWIGSTVEVFRLDK